MSNYSILFALLFICFAHQSWGQNSDIETILRPDSRNQVAELSADKSFRYVVISDFNRVLLWDRTKQKFVKGWNNKNIFCAAISPDGQWLAIGYQVGNHVDIFSTADFSLHDSFRFRTESNKREVRVVNFSPDSRFLVAMSYHGESVIRDVIRRTWGGRNFTFDAGNFSTGAFFSTDDNSFVIASTRGEGVAKFDLDAGGKMTLLRDKGHEVGFNAPVINSENHGAVFALKSGRIVGINRYTGELLFDIHPSPKPANTLVTPLGHQEQFIYAANYWRSRPQQAIQSPRVEVRGINDGSFIHGLESPDETIISLAAASGAPWAFAGLSTQIAVWDVLDQALIDRISLPIHLIQPLRCEAILTDSQGKVLYAALGNGSVIQILR
jgi:hypothetical protein